MLRPCLKLIQICFDIITEQSADWTHASELIELLVVNLDTVSTFIGELTQSNQNLANMFMLDILVEEFNIFALFDSFICSKQVINCHLGLQMAEYFRTFVMKMTNDVSKEKTG